MERDVQKITLFDAVTPTALTSSTDATPIVVTATSHGIKNGQRVLLVGHTTNIAANGIFVAKAVTANTFALSDEFTGADVAGSGGGSGSSGICVLAPPIINTRSFRNIIFQLGTSGTTTSTLKVYGSVGVPDNATNTVTPRKDMPNFGGTLSPANNYTALQIIDLDTAAAVNGATGMVVSGTDLFKQYECNVNVMPYITVFPITWTGGVITLVAFLATNV